MTLIDKSMLPSIPEDGNKPHQNDDTGNLPRKYVDGLTIHSVGLKESMTLNAEMATELLFDFLYESGSYLVKTEEVWWVFNAASAPALTEGDVLEGWYGKDWQTTVLQTISMPVIEDGNCIEPEVFLNSRLPFTECFIHYSATKVMADQVAHGYRVLNGMCGFWGVGLNPPERQEIKAFLEFIGPRGGLGDRTPWSAKIVIHQNK